MEFIYPIQVLPEDIDQLGHVNNIIYLKWVQEAATGHWSCLATEEMKRNYVWMIVRHEIDYLKSCVLESNIVAKTWVGESEGVKSVRFVALIEPDTQKIMAKVKTTWILLDVASKRPKRVTPEIIELFK
ncbi:MAG: acyl-CoA thioesterase [Bacteroidia bacterium]|nr:acyl-CoA thioesterase [Bacteroidia bacterium]